MRFDVMGKYGNFRLVANSFSSFLVANSSSASSYIKHHS